MHSNKIMAERLNTVLKLRRIGKIYGLAATMGVSESTISRWRHGKPISTANLAKLCLALDISAHWLLTGQGEIESPGDSRAADWRRGFCREVEMLGPPSVKVVAQIFHMLEGACTASNE